MDLKLKYGAHRSPDRILAALTAAGVQLDSTVKTQSWPDNWELQASKDLDFLQLEHAVAAVSSAACPDEIAISVRVVRAGDTADLLFTIPCDDWQRAADALREDILAFRGKADPFRSWFRGQWMGQRDEDALTEQELASAPLTPERILGFLEPSVFRDWRPIQSYVARHASCEQLVQAMVAAQTSTQKWRLAYAFNRRNRSCEAAIRHLIEWLQDADRRVREEAADSLGVLVLALRGRRSRAHWSHQAGAALLTYVTDHSDDNLYFARTALGATGYEPARSYLEELARTGSGSELDSAERGLRNLNEAAVTGEPTVNRSVPARS